MSKFKTELMVIRNALMTGVSYMVPVVVAGGMLFAISFIGGEGTSAGYIVSNPFMLNLKAIGSAALSMMVPVFGAYVAYGIAGRPGLAPGFVLSFLANNPFGEKGIKTGYLGALFLSILVGYVVKWLKNVEVPKSLRSIMPVLILPTVSTLVVGLAYAYIFVNPIGSLTDYLLSTLRNLSGTNTILMAIIISLALQFDVGGPATKAVSMFCTALMTEGIYEPNGIFRTTIGISAFAILISTYLHKNKWSDSEKTAAKSNALMGFMGIGEGGIPFIVADPKAIWISTMVGSSVAGIIAAVGGIKSYVPHGGLINFPLIEGKTYYAIAWIVGIIVTVVLLGLLKKPANKGEENE